LLSALRMAMGISVQAADQIGTVSTVQLRAVTVLHQWPGVNLGELAQHMGVSVSVTSRLVDRLGNAGLVEKRPSPTSGREVSLWLSPEGKKILDRYDDLRLARLREHLHALPTDQAAAVVSALEAHEKRTPMPFLPPTPRPGLRRTRPGPADRAEGRSPVTTRGRSAGSACRSDGHLPGRQTYGGCGYALRSGHDRS